MKTIFALHTMFYDSVNNYHELGNIHVFNTFNEADNERNRRISVIKDDYNISDENIENFNGIQTTIYFNNNQGIYEIKIQEITIWSV